VRPCSPTPSVGIVVARLIELELEKDRWRDFSVVRQKGGATCGLPLRQEVRQSGLNPGILSTSFSMIATHPFKTVHEFILPLWSPAAQTRRRLLTTHARQNFLSFFIACFSHGMFPTSIQLDDFSPILAHRLECLIIEKPKAREWTCDGDDQHLSPSRLQPATRCRRVVSRFISLSIYFGTVGYVCTVEYKWCKTTPGHDKFV
jgi:hypothetical protein